MRRILMLMLALSLMLAAVPCGFATEEMPEETVAVTETAVSEEETLPLRQPGQCGEALYWSYDSGVLTISGNGNMDDYPDGDAPWLTWKDSIRQVVFSGNVTSVGEGAFTDYDKLETVDFGSAMHTIGIRAFKSCDGLTSITLPAAFRRFGEESFMSCRNLTQIICRGGMPSFNLNCVWDTYAALYYPANNPWPAEHVQQLTQAFQNRIEFRMGTPTDYTPAETTQPTVQTQPTEPQETVPVQTEPAATVAVTEETAAEETVEETETQLPENPWTETVAETEPDAQKKAGGMSGVMVGLCLVTGVLSLVLIVALIFRRRRW